MKTAEKEIKKQSGSPWKRAVQETGQWKWAAWDARAALRCLPATAGLLICGMALNHPVAGMVAAGGALPAGFGSFERLRASRVAPMLLSTLGIGLCTFVGTLAGSTTPTAVLLAGTLGWCWGMAASLGPGAWWIGLQCVIFALIAGAYPAHLAVATSRAALVLAGGLVQTLVVVAFWRLAGGPPQAARPGDTRWLDWPGLRREARPALETLRRNRTPKAEPGREALRVAVTLAVAVGLARLLSLPSSYWVAMTAALVLKADMPQTLAQSIARVGGTLGGVGLVTLITWALRPGPPALIVLITLFSVLCYAFLRVNYAIYTACITAYILFLLAFGLPEQNVVLARVLDTALGGVLALLGHALWPAPKTSPAPSVKEQHSCL